MIDRRFNSIEILARAYDNQTLELENKIVECAMYKAVVFHKDKLYEILQTQLQENIDAIVGEFNGFSYDSRRAQAVFRSLEDLYKKGIITKSEYKFCK